MVVEKRIKGVAWIYTVDKGEGGKKSQNYFGCHVSMAQKEELWQRRRVQAGEIGRLRLLVRRRAGPQLHAQGGLRGR